MKTKQKNAALRKHRQREAAKRAERLEIMGYPYSHNPYLPHEPMADCYAGCKGSAQNDGTPQP